MVSFIAPYSIAQIAGLSREVIQSLTRGHCALANTQIAGFTATQSAGMTPEQHEALVHAVS